MLSRHPSRLAASLALTALTAGTAAAVIGTGAPAAADTTSASTTTVLKRTVARLDESGRRVLLRIRTVTEPATVEGHRLCSRGVPEHLTGGEHSAHQRRMARVIWDVSERLDIPMRARVVAYATTWQEAWMRNLTWGHADSRGLFQQRPSQGWRNVNDPELATAAFYRALLEMPGWRDMPVTAAAQAVQASATPRGYADDTGRAAATVGWLAGIPCDQQMHTRLARVT